MAASLLHVSYTHVILKESYTCEGTLHFTDETNSPGCPALPDSKANITSFHWTTNHLAEWSRAWALGSDDLDPCPDLLLTKQWEF